MTSIRTFLNVCLFLTITWIVGMAKAEAATPPADTYAKTLRYCQTFSRADVEIQMSTTSLGLGGSLPAGSGGFYFQIFGSSFKEAAIEFNFFSWSDGLKRTIHDPGYARALSDCYGSDNEMKAFFTAGLYAADLSGKVVAGVATVLVTKAAGALLNAVTFMGRKIQLAVNAVMYGSFAAALTTSVLDFLEARHQFREQFPRVTQAEDGAKGAALVADVTAQVEQFRSQNAEEDRQTVLAAATEKMQRRIEGLENELRTLDPSHPKHKIVNELLAQYRSTQRGLASIGQ